MKNRRLLGERVAVRVAGCPTRDGVLISGVKKKTKFIQKFHVRFPNGDVRTYRGDQLLLRGNQAPLVEYIRVGDIVFTKKTLGVVRFIGLHEDYKGPVMVIEPVDPKLPRDTSVKSYPKLFPSANLSDDRTYRIITRVEEILKLLPPDSLLQQISKIKDKYLALVEETRERDRMFEEERDDAKSRVKELEQQALTRENKPDKIPTKKPKPVEVPQIVSFTFQPGRLGIQAKWEIGEVVSVIEDGQAMKLGIQEGWKITQVDGEPYTEDKLDAKTDGECEYNLTFQIPVPKVDIKPGPQTKILASSVLHNKVCLSPVEKKRFEDQVSELSDQIEEYQYKVEALKTKNKKLEEEQKEITHLRVKVEKLRNSRALFINQIKDIKKKEKEFKSKADDFERKRGELVEQAGGIGIEAKSDRGNGPSAPPPIPRGKSAQKKKVGRRMSAKMPTPDAQNMIRLI